MDDNLMVPISRQSAGSSQSQPKKETTYPTELIDLPSQGYFYPNEVDDCQRRRYFDEPEPHQKGSGFRYSS